MELLRFATAGSVDDGKSTLIGRLLLETKQIFEDTLEALEHSTMLRGEEGMNLALLTDGLRAEREQGITIDVAYRYFATPRRKFIIADTPGHIQYTRNMVTGAVGDDEPAPGRREVAVGDVDRDALLALRAQAVGQQREVELVRAPPLRDFGDVLELIFERGFGVVQEPADQRRLAVVDGARRREPQQFGFGVESRHQK